MKNHSLFRPTSPRAIAPAWTFALPGLLPTDRRLLLDPPTRSAIVMALPGSEVVPSLQIFALTPSATRILLTLLQAYPLSCSHQALFRSLYPLRAPRREEVWDKDLALPPVRRALKTLMPTLRAMGLQTLALRGQGYVLAAVEASRASDGDEADPGE